MKRWKQIVYISWYFVAVLTCEVVFVGYVQLKVSADETELNTTSTISSFCYLTLILCLPTAML